MTSLVVVLAVVVAAVRVSTITIKCVDAARTGARTLALGADEGQVQATVEQAVGSAADAEISRSGEWVTVTVTAPVLLGGALGHLTAHGTVTTKAEP